MVQAELATEPWPGFATEVANAVSSHRTVGAIVYDMVRSAIVSGSLKAGQRLKQEQLAKAFGVSRIPVRTALMQLQSEDLVQFRPGKGAVVSGQTVDQVREIYEIRELLETYALRRSMASMLTDRVKRLRELADQLDGEAEGAEFVELRVQFYRELYDADRNVQLVKIIESLRSQVGRNLLTRRVAGAREVGAHGHHRTLVEHVASGNVADAQTWLRTHLEAVREGVEAIVAAEANGSVGAHE